MYDNFTLRIICIFSAYLTWVIFFSDKVVTSVLVPLKSEMVHSLSPLFSDVSY